MCVSSESIAQKIHGFFKCYLKKLLEKPTKIGQKNISSNIIVIIFDIRLFVDVRIISNIYNILQISHCRILLVYLVKLLLIPYTDV